MKKIFSLLFIGLMCITGCKKDDNTSQSNSKTISTNTSGISTNSSQNSTSTSSSSSSSNIPTQIGPVYELSTPALSLNTENGVVEWDTIEGADYYNYVINDGEIQTTTGTLIELEDKSNLSVQAVSVDKYSKWSNAVTFYDTSDVILEGNGKIHNVYFHDTDYKSVQVRDCLKVDRPNNPTKVHYNFDNWYADPFYTTVFDFNLPITKSTVIYAHYTPTNFVDNVYYWIKANNKMSASNQGSFTSDSGWGFIPLKEDTSSSLKEFSAIVTVSNASDSSPCQFLVMDGLDDNSGRTYYKNGNSDFKITVDGIYRITFSVETLYLLNGNQVNAKFELVNQTGINSKNYLDAIQLTTPTVTIDGDKNIAIISKVNQATKYEVIINNGTPKNITNNQVDINKGEHISVRAIKGDNIYSNWSVPKANINYVFEEVIEPKTHASVYFYDSNTDAEMVEINTYVEQITPIKDGYKFLGWYLDLARKKPATFPYLVTDNVVFYPSWEIASDVLTKEYYEFVDSNENKIAGLTWNTDNYDFYEYEAKGVYLAFGEQYYVKSLTTSENWGPYTVDESGTYNIYFSEEHIWDVNTENESNIYFAATTKTIYFTNVKGWSDTIYAYVWNSSSDQPFVSWPGTEMTYLETNSYGQQVYTIDVDVSVYDMIIFSHGTNGNIVTQTIDISLNNNDNGFYVTNKNSSGKYEIATYSR